MQVVSHQPHAWFLLKNGEAYYLDVNCNQSSFGFDIVIRLTEEEFKEYHGLGLVYIEYLAARVAYWWREYWPRNCADMAMTIDEAIKAHLENEEHNA